MITTMDDFVRSIIWRRLDTPGHEWAQGLADESGSQFHGTSIFVDEGKPCFLEYLVACDTDGETISVEVLGEVGDDLIEIEILVGDDGVWTMNEEEIGEVEGCVDIDLNFSPITNTLPIRRLNLAVGASQKVAAAWLRFPSFKLERFEQTYTRVDENTYHYESRDGEFKRDLTVDEYGMVTNYPGFWTEERG
jgi:hypothetical protein